MPFYFALAWRLDYFSQTISAKGIPTKKEINGLPRRAMAVFAARCARRVLPLALRLTMLSEPKNRLSKLQRAGLRLPRMIRPAPTGMQTKQRRQPTQSTILNSRTRTQSRACAGGLAKPRQHEPLSRIATRLPSL